MNTSHWKGGYVHTFPSSLPTTHACGCIGPQNGDPVCPCRMRSMQQVNGRWVEQIDHGPVRSTHASELAGRMLAEYKESTH